MNTEPFEAYNSTPKELYQAMTDEFGSEWLCWEPETLWEELPNETSEQARNKIQAIQVIVSNGLFWKDWDVFEKVCVAFNDGAPRFDLIDDITAAEMGYAIRVAEDIRAMASLPGKMPTLSEEVINYIAIRSYMDGLVYLPKPLEIAQSKLNELTKLGKLAIAIERACHSPHMKMEEHPIPIGAVRAKIITAYAYSDKRKEI